MADFSNAQRLLVDSKSVVVFDRAMPKVDVRQLVRYWTLQERQHRDECIAYLKTKTELSDFETTTGTVSGDFRTIGVTYEDGDDLRIIQQLEAEINTVAAITEAGTRWRYKGGKDWQSGNSLIILELPFCDPDSVRTMSKENGLKSYVDAIYTTNGGVLDGKWYSLFSEVQINPESGYGVINWYLSRFYNQDLIFSAMAGPNERIVDFFKIHMMPDTVEDFFKTYFFDSKGNFYISADSGVTYNNKNGTSVDPSVNFEDAGIDASLLGTAVSGRTIQISESPNEESAEILLHVRISWNTGRDTCGVVYADRHGSITTSIQLFLANAERRSAFLEKTYIDSLTGYWYYSENGGTFSELNGVESYGSLPAATAKKISDQVAGRSLRIQTSPDEVIIQCRFIRGDKTFSYLNHDARLVYKPSPLASVVMDQAQNITAEELETAMAYYASDPADGTSRNMSPPRQDAETRLWSYEALEITKSAFATVLRIGGETVYLGINYPKEPTTDPALFNADSGVSSAADSPISDHYYLLGGVYDGVSGTWSTRIGSTSNTTQYCEKSDENGTWNWRVRHIVEDSVVIGESNPAIASSSMENYILEYGDPDDFYRWIGRYPVRDYAAGTISLLGYYEDIPAASAGTFGTHGILKGRRKVTRSIRNEKLEGNTITYDVWEHVVTAPINDDDGWFCRGVAPGLERKKKSLASDLIDGTGDRWSAAEGRSAQTAFSHVMNKVTDAYEDGSLNDGNADGVLDTDDLIGFTGGMTEIDVPVIASLEAAWKRRKTMKVDRKYFMQEPTTSVLAGTVDHVDGENSISIYEAMTAAADADTAGSSPSSLETVTYDIVQSGGMWAVVRTTLQKDDEFYRDDDAFDKLKDSSGGSLLGMQLQMVHMQTVADPNEAISPTVIDSDKVHLRLES
ncbi:MAG: hypothetical protein JXR25_11840 [Pontiellaceae bacterium]|nr:hypothetical protein [Pontiellaceae bacterium]